MNVVVAVIIDGNCILATQRGYGDFKDGWEFPGGKIEPGETPEQAVVRELREELAVTIVPEKMFMTVEYDYPQFHLIMHCFLARVEAGEINLLEHEAMKWLSKDDIDTVDWLPADAGVVAYLKEHVLA